MNMNIDVNCIAVIGKQNNPLYIKNFSTTHPDLKYHYIAHTSIDVIEERVTQIKTPDVYLGLLYAMEDLAVYGYMTNTRVKFIIVVSVPDAVIKDADMKNLFRRVHTAYIMQVCNPFYNSDSHKPIESRQFSRVIDIIGKTAGGKVTGVGGPDSSA
ncbi:trafficking protein particle complex 2 [Jimgerdemannia flammicorona]|uniref:Trafficking protein particle complex 2 n=2 Tax=Jimgerdemannia flammicorona TaxID=994334 RepID=A0A433DKG2_9FUNG|nr:trafficking protein particle complex 2 [Jimgerdemannia flammicorona]RUS28081.1 trafficking protein particle complex 2 [Jimgerdemannia flammicorona]